jgi:hypothetical protein
MSSYLSRTVQGWVDSSRDMTKTVFTSPALVYAAIENGTVWDPSPKLGPLDITTSVQRALYAYITPFAWSLSAEDLGPFIANANDMTPQGTGCNAYDPTSAFRIDTDFDHGVLDATLVCDNGTPYWLVNIQRGKNPTYNKVQSGGAPPAIQTLPGISNLDGKKFGGLTKEDLVLRYALKFPHLF